MGVSAEKLVKTCIKQIAKTQELDYDEVKDDCKKVVKMARKFDEQLLALMEDLLELSNVGSPDELEEFDIDVLKMYCRIKELDDSVSDKKIRAQVWEHMQEEFELSDEDSEEDSEDDFSEEDSEEESEEEPEPEPKIIEVLPETEKAADKPKKSKKSVTISE
jgi:predicted site-specific integrase-resolvase